MSVPSRRRIELLQTLGQGGFGAVYLADVHSRDDFVQRLAVKVLSAEMSADADVAARQRDEARLLARLNHDHIVRVVDLTEIDGRPAVLMEYVEGVDAGELLRRGPLPVKAALQVGAAAASALDAAWSSVGPRSGKPLRVIHRDIKPANLLVSRHGGVKVLDFGIARADFDREGQTGSVQFGTARFMAPEQWLFGRASNKVDVYALGVSLVEMLSGMHMERAPLDALAFAAHIEAVRAAVRHPEWPEVLAEGIDQLLGRMLAFSPEHRPDAGEVLESLSHLVDLAPGEGLRRWAREAVPPALAAVQARWAERPPPALGLGVPTPVSVEADPTRATAPQAHDATQATPPQAHDATAPLAPRASAPQAPRTTAPLRGAAAPEEVAPLPVDTLAVPLPRARGARRPAVVAGAVAALAVLALGGAFLLPRLGGPEEAPPLSALEDAFEQAPPVQAVPVQAPPAVEVEGEDPEPEPVPEPAPPSVATPSPARKAAATAAPAPPVATAAPPPAATEAAPAASDSAASDSAASDSAASDSAAAAPPAAPPEAAPTVAVTLTSAPWGAQVAVDGRVVGTTPLRGHALPVGTHTVTMTLGEHSSTRTITIGGRNPTSHTWTVETGQWRSSS